MKHEHFYSFFIFFIFWKILFLSLYIINLLTLQFLWKISNYADSYWFLYSNKKMTYEDLFINY